jgi:SAM-dependent methyltransferase
MGEGGHDHARSRYLAAKRSVDDRARSRRVRDRLLDALDPEPRVVEAGCGLGFTVPTLADWGVTPRRYRGVDLDGDVVEHARWLVPRVRRRAGATVEATATGCVVDGHEVTVEQGDALSWLPEQEADLLVAQSFLDLVPPEKALDAVRAALVPGGLAYAPITFDGVTLFVPEHPADAEVERAFHAAIDATKGRDSRTGRHLLDRLRRRDETLLAVGASDWVVRPVDGGYRADERYFLECILGFVAETLTEVPNGEAWLDRRHRQLDRAELTYVAHGYDLLWRVPP